MGKNLEESIPILGLDKIVELLNCREFLQDFVLELALVPHSQPFQDDPEQPAHEHAHQRENDQHYKSILGHLDLHINRITIHTDDRRSRLTTKFNADQIYLGLWSSMKQ